MHTALHKAFTMIELIFVIVILGILAAVAIPKLAATRGDAQVSKIAMNIMTGASEIASYAMSQAKTEDNLSVMSNAVANMEASGEASISTAEKKAVIQVGSVNDCATIQVQTGANDDNLTISFGDPGSDTLCVGLQGAIDASQYPMKLRGTSVNY
ncbi:prepilin-type N-terminal cleavage/methylation domain-containing protein [Sulfurimonas sediminis]|uniref:Prepilin-type N-terminal cleavage/methylation domain-containing protein n=1 Tax=Sulfurimonas sediminis TaxID=2590020 RepID=A0A7M1AZI5_9BACT|nr:prepilin-type N-terminal cleavage/methylation domain-containing protein [Sulfurimonas sediminis]QOP42785.1 prepilin-type N-terminal cleavage/methylation domain-containing protein [Sulfurimonas sediminis]